MIFQVSALKQIVDFLEEHKIPFMVIGGIANAERGRVRATEDADLKIQVRDRTISEFRALAEGRFKPYRRPWLGKVESALIVSVELEQGMVVDMLVAVLSYEEQAIQRAEKIDGVLYRQRGKLDIKYIRNWLTQFAEALENPEMLKRFDELMRTQSNGNK